MHISQDCSKPGTVSLTYHELLASDSVWETWEVLHIGGCGELTSGRNAVGKHALVEDRLQFCAREVDGGSVGGWPRAND
jgi:hypothetical protein